jgi:spore coat protein A
MFTRRSFLQVTGAVGAATLVPWQKLLAIKPLNLARYVDALPIPPAIDLTAGGAVTLGMAAGTHQFHRDLPATTAFGYGGAGYLGPTILAKEGRPITVTWENNLPSAYPGSVPLDPTLLIEFPTSGGLPAVPHLHGGFTLPQFDGTPFQWFNSAGQTGSNYVTNTYTYGNEQRAANLWYHDHAVGVTRFNPFCGLAGYYLLRDDIDTGLANNPLGLPAGNYEVPLVIQDRIFNPDGSLFYSPPNNGVQAVNPAYPHPVWIPEYFGDTAVVNGKAYPFCNLEPRRYRFRIINGSNARFYNMWFQVGNTIMPFHQIGTDQGLLPAPAPLTKLLIGPGERADIMVDFAGIPAGTKVFLKNNAKAPFPGGMGGDVPNIMQFLVNLPLAGTDTTTPAPNLVLPAITPLPAAVRNRQIVLNEVLDPITGVPMQVMIDNTPFTDAATETPTYGDTEVWEFINTTGDAHPMHTHLVSFEIVNRQPFNAKAYLAAFLAAPPGTKPDVTPYLLGAPVAPPANEMGRKDTARAMPGEVLRIKAKFDVPTGAIQLATGQTNPEWVYHCHILEHEENDMMRPLQVLDVPNVVV